VHDVLLHFIEVHTDLPILWDVSYKSKKKAACDEFITVLKEMKYAT
jgi:uncharacterized protein YbdZ (MbtH family)